MNSNGDVLVRAITTDGLVNCFACVTSNLTEEAKRRHNLYPIATAALGRLMAGGLMLASLLKGREKLVLSIKATGPIGGLSAEARPNGTVRGFVQNPHVELPSRENKLAVGAAVGGGFLYVTRFLEDKGYPYQGVVELVSGEISSDLTYYLAASEQTPSAVSLGVFVETDNSVSAAGGIMVQTLPGATDAQIEILEKNVERLSGISQQIKAGATPAELISFALKDLQFKLLSEQQLKYHCPCSAEMVRSALHLLSRKDIVEMLEEDNYKVYCQFCGDEYSFSRRELEEILKNEAHAEKLPE